jgi:hypothetical protein
MPRTPQFLHNEGLPDVIGELRKPGHVRYTGWIGVGVEPGTGIGSDEPTAEEYIPGISPPFLNSWVNVTGDSISFARLAFYMAEDGELRLRGHVRGGAVGSAIFRLPSGYRPEYDETFRQPNDAGGSATIQVSSDGYVYLIVNTVT